MEGAGYEGALPHSSCISVTPLIYSELVLCPDPPFLSPFVLLSLPLSRLFLSTQISQLHFEMSAERLMLLPEYQQRMQVLKRLRYINDEEAVQLKVCGEGGGPVGAPGETAKKWNKIGACVLFWRELNAPCYEQFLEILRCPSCESMD